MTRTAINHSGARPAAECGFTLVEVLAALAILAVAMFVLLDAHYTALNLHADMDAEVTARQLLESIVSRAELEIRAGNLTDSGDFGTRHTGYTWAFEALPSGSDQTILLYEVTATVTMEQDERQLKFYVFDTGVGSLLDTGSTSQKSVFDET